MVPVSNFRGDTVHIHTNFLKNLPYDTFFFPAPSGNSNTLVIWFHGGCFIDERPKNILPFLEFFSEYAHAVDIFTFDYPLPFKFSFDDTLIYVNYILKDLLAQHDYTNVYFAGDSAGAFFAVKTMEIEMSSSMRKELKVDAIGCHINGFIGICGFYDTTFNNNALGEMVFKFYLMRNIKSTKKYKKSNVIHPMLIVTSSSDFLLDQSRNFADRHRSYPNNSYKVFNTPNTTHCFLTNIHLPETKELAVDILEFIEANLLVKL
jgi:acetyl esterase/lipase